MSKGDELAEQVALVSYSECLVRRVRGFLGPGRHGVEHVRGPRALARHRRQRPFLLCLLDARGSSFDADVAACLECRPAERYVVVLGTAAAGPGYQAPRGGGVFGFLREPFGAPEMQAWVQRATDEARLRRGDRSLEELLYGKFQEFLRDLGPQGPSASLHAFVLERVERPLLAAVLEWTGGNQSRAAEVLGIHRNTLRAKIKSLGVDPVANEGAGG